MEEINQSESSDEEDLGETGYDSETNLPIQAQRVRTSQEQSQSIVDKGDSLKEVREKIRQKEHIPSD